MKLKYLLPVATVASVATIVTPFVTSCGSSNTITWDWIKKGSYKPKYEPLKKQSMTLNAATTAYFNDVSKKQLIFCDDLMYTINYVVSAEVKTKTEANATAKILSVDAPKHLLSFIWKMNLVGKDDRDENISLELDVTFKNLEYLAAANIQSNTLWAIKSVAGQAEDFDSMLSALNENKGWSINGFMSMKNGDDPASEAKYDYSESKQPTAENYNDLNNILTHTIFSHYLRNITQKK